MKQKPLFVYGSLLVGTGSPEIDRMFTRCCRRVAFAYVHAHLYDLGAYPGVVVSDPSEKARVQGAVFRIATPKQCLPSIDRYEGYDPDHPERSEFIRAAITAYRLPRNEPVEAWIYLYNGRVDHLRRIDGGDYVEFKRQDR
ncbi:MAG: gamma-glutamylcyclotransferase [Gammaproteobacteria bacterium]|nr:gamma-glutamylcyclotransferase [Gammaproteobacteria bacterium]